MITSSHSIVLLSVACLTGCAGLSDAGAVEDSGGTADESGAEVVGSSEGGADDSGTEDSGGLDEGDSTGGEPDPTGGVVGEGLPCEIDAILADYCRSCHGPTPSGGAPQSLLTLDDLLDDALTAPGQTVAQVSLDRFGEVPNPMPPLPASPLPADLVDTWAAWVADGTPAGNCDPMPEPDPFDVEPMCSSGVVWQGDEGQRMDPGQACINCHANDQEEEGPIYAFAGTLFPTGHEPDNCYGVDGTVADVYVEVGDANGQSHVMSVNSAGNFFAMPWQLPDGFDPPWTAKVVADGLERAMVGTITSGDCNVCHTQDGTENAPGRIILP